MLNGIVSAVNDALYSYILIILLVACGIYFTIRTKFAPFRLFREQLRAVMEKPTENGGVSSFQALMVSTASLVILLGSGLSADFLWNVADVTMGGMTLINIPVILILGKYALRALADYEKQRKEGVEPVFHAKDIDLPHKVDYWE